MTAAEIVRRIRALLKQDPKKRPVSVDRLEEIAGLADNGIYDIARAGRMQERTRLRLERALTLVENDQLVVKKGHGAALHRRQAEVSVRAPQPPQAMVRRVTFTSQGPKVILQAVNPHAFPEFDPPTIKGVKRANGRR